MSYHHPKTAEAYNVLSKYWKDKTDITEDAVYYSHSATQNRCGKCWLRRHQCYCNIAEDRIQYYKTNFSENISNCQIIMYYHYQEIGRSANTAHVFELICPHICSTLLYGDVEHESILFNEMRKEYELGILRTCVLYPSSDAMNIKDWIDKYSDPELLSTQRKSFHRSSNIGDDHSEGSNNALEDINYFINMKFRIIALDGTYKQAERLMKHIRKMLSSNPSSLSNSENDTGIEPNNEVSLKASCGRINPDTKGLKNIPAPTVKLYLTGNSCASAVAGIMYQPRPDTLCTYQALVIALEQANATKYNPYANRLRDLKIIDELEKDLENWLLYVVSHKIKFGKTRERNRDGIIDRPPSDKLKLLLAHNPPPVGKAMKQKGCRTVIEYDIAKLNAILSVNNQSHTIYLKPTKAFTVFEIDYVT